MSSYTTRYYGIGIKQDINDDGFLKYIPDDLEDEVSVNLSRELFGEEQKVFHCFEDCCAAATTTDITYSEFMEALLNVSAAYPTLYFDIEGRGDDWDDWWVARIHNNGYGIKMAEVPDVDDIEDFNMTI